MKVAKTKGRLHGKQPKLKPNQAKHLLELHDLGTYTQAELAVSASDVHDQPHARCCGVRSISCSTHATSARAREAVLWHLGAIAGRSVRRRGALGPVQAIGGGGPPRALRLS
jgi:hypothetical protein